MPVWWSLHKNINDGVLRASGLVNTCRFGEIGVLRECGSSLPFLIPCPTRLFHLAVPELYPFIINQWSSKSNVSLSSVSSSSKLIELKERSLEPPIYSLPEAEVLSEPGLVIGIWSVGMGDIVLWDWACLGGENLPLPFWVLLAALIKLAQDRFTGENQSELYVWRSQRYGT